MYLEQHLIDFQSDHFQMKRLLQDCCCCDGAAGAGSGAAGAGAGAGAGGQEWLRYGKKEWLAQKANA